VANILSGLKSHPTPRNNNKQLIENCRENCMFWWNISLPTLWSILSQERMLPPFAASCMTYSSGFKMEAPLKYWALVLAYSLTIQKTVLFKLYGAITQMITICIFMYI
jgi:hypothetical protein